MKKALVTIAAGEYFARMAALTHPTLMAYADKVGADFIVWSDVSGYKIAEYKKMEVGALLDVYDRVLYVDTDIIIRDDAPDIFALVPYDHLGMLEESDYYDRRLTVLRFMEHIGFDSTVWNGKYYNAGLFVCSQVHRDLFVRPPTEWDHFRDQTFFNTLIADRKAKVFSLPYRFNRVLGMDRVYGEDRLDCYFLHYAGTGIVLSAEERLDLIAHDLSVWRQAAPDYRFRHNLLFVPSGGLGEQVAAEPAVRYAREVLYPTDNLAIVSEYPEVFRHLTLPIFRTVEDVPHVHKYLRLITDGRVGNEAGLALPAHQVHPTTLASLATLGLELPLARRRPRLVVDPAALANLRNRLAPHKVEDLVVLHPGRGLPAVTFPAVTWRAYFEELLNHGIPVAIIGNTHGGTCEIVDVDRSGTIDLVNRLSMAETIALVSQAPMLISNDAAPVQLAGAFDGWIGLIATSRHAECVLPWRNSSPWWRAQDLARAPLYHDYMHRPSGGAKPELDQCDPQRLRACLPQPQDVLSFVRFAQGAPTASGDTSA
jgi:hypothetical protein